MNTRNEKLKVNEEDGDRRGERGEEGEGGERGGGGGGKQEAMNQDK